MKFLLIFLISFFSCSNINANELTGVWSYRDSIHPSDKVEMTFSWGKSYMGRNGGTIVIDDISDDPRFYISGFGYYSIKEKNEIDEITSELVFYFDLDDMDIHCIINWLDNENFWIEDIDGISMFPTGEKWIYQRLDGPCE